ncbi:MAG: NADH-quinone oxidoreductase subunit M [Gemmatales bacterium]
MGFVNVWDELDFWLMTAVIVTPLVFALGLLLVPARRVELIRWWTLIGTLATFVLTSFLFIDFLRWTDQHLTNPDRQAQLLPARINTQLANYWRGAPASLSNDLVARKPWIGRYHIDYSIGVDGLSMAMLLLSAVLFVLAFLASWKITKAVRGYCILFLILETGVMGLFLSLDFFLFYVFFEAMLVPMFFLIGYWGGPRKEYAAIKFFLYTLLGSILILVAMLALYFVDLRPYYKDLVAQAEGKERFSAEVFRRDAFLGLAGSVRYDKGEFMSPVNTFDLIVLGQAAQASTQLETNVARIQAQLRDRSEDQSLHQQMDVADQHKLHWQAMSPEFQLFCFILLFLGFAIKVPIVPLHTWLPDAHVEAPTPISMLLAAILLKTGAYGILRIAVPLCPWAAEQLASVVGLIGIVAIVYGALVALAQTNLKRLIAYSSISHMGYVLLGIAVWTSPEGAQFWSWGMKGAVFQMIAHGITSAGMFYVAGLVYERVGHYDLNRMGGLMGPMPTWAGLSTVVFLGAMGLPLLCGFIGEFCVLLGTWNFKPEHWPAAGQVFTMVAAGTLILTAGYILWAMQRMMFGTRKDALPLDDLDGREGFILTVFALLTVLLGVWPMLVFDWLEPTLTGLVQLLAQVTAR